MIDLIRDSFFGNCLRLVTGGKVLSYPEELDPSTWQRYINEDKSANMADHCKTEVPESELSGQHQGGTSRTRPSFPGRSSSAANGVESGQYTRHALRNKSESPRRVDPEKGRDVYLVDWYGPDDPEVCLRCVFSHPQPLVAFCLTSPPEPESPKLVPRQEVLRHL